MKTNSILIILMVALAAIVACSGNNTQKNAEAEAQCEVKECGLPVGLQLYSVRDDMAKDFKGTLTINTNIKDIRKYSVEHIKSDFPMFKGSDNYFRYSKDGYYPDLLLPVENEINIVKGINIFWVEINADKDNIGNNELLISVKKTIFLLQKLH